MKTLELIGFIAFVASIVLFYSLGQIMFVPAAIAAFIVSVVAHGKAESARLAEYGI